MKIYEATSSIQASPEVIWAILTDAPGYSRWDSGVERIEGTIAPGEVIKVFSKLDPGRAFPVTVSEFSPTRQMVWTGGMPMGIFKGVRTFTLTSKDTSTRFRVREEFSGPMSVVILRFMPDMGPSFEQFANGLQREAEKQAG